MVVWILICTVMVVANGFLAPVTSTQSNMRSLAKFVQLVVILKYNMLLLAVPIKTSNSIVAV